MNTKELNASEVEVTVAADATEQTKDQNYKSNRNLSVNALGGLVTMWFNRKRGNFVPYIQRLVEKDGELIRETVPYYLNHHQAEYMNGEEEYYSRYINKGEYLYVLVSSLKAGDTFRLCYGEEKYGNYKDFVFTGQSAKYAKENEGLHDLEIRYKWDKARKQDEDNKAKKSEELVASGKALSERKYTGKIFSIDLSDLQPIKEAVKAKYKDILYEQEVEWASGENFEFNFLIKGEEMENINRITKELIEMLNTITDCFELDTVTVDSAFRDAWELSVVISPISYRDYLNNLIDNE